MVWNARRGVWRVSFRGGLTGEIFREFFCGFVFFGLGGVGVFFVGGMGVVFFFFVCGVVVFGVFFVFFCCFWFCGW